jgi:serine/threonine protein kinase
MVYYNKLTFVGCTPRNPDVDNRLMNGQLDRFVSLLDLHESVILPDGTRPLQLGSGSITALIGTGGMSNVYKIWNPQMETSRAVKLMKPNLSQESRQRFQTEIKITAAFSHPNIIEIHSVGEWNSLAYIEMELIDGFTLSEILSKKGALPIQVCTAIAVMVARALVYAHSKEYVLYGKTYHGVIHRDLKPSNIMIGYDGRVKLMDFGIARPVDSSLMTMDGAVMGTMQYLAPEQIDGKNVGVTADIYALGAVLYETLTGKKSFPQINLSQLMEAKTKNYFIPLQRYKIQIPQRLKKLVARCMMHDSTKRMPTATAVLEELELIHKKVTKDSPEEAIKHFLPSSNDTQKMLVVRKRVPLPASLFVIAGVLVLVVAGLFVYSPKKPKPQIPGAAAMPHPTTAVVKTEPVPDTHPTPTAAVHMAGSAAKQPSRAVSVAKESKKVTPKSTTVAAPAENLSYLEKMKASTGIGDPLELMAKQAGEGNYTGVLQLFQELPAPLAGEKNAQMLRLRALYQLGNTLEAAEILSGPAIDDGEFYLIKAKFLFGKGALAQSLAMLEKSVGVTAHFIEPETVHRDYFYYRALCLSGLFDQVPSDDNRKNALDSWFEVKNAMRKFASHEYYKKAVSEMQRIGTGAVSNNR